jgi:hypothetical protein
MAQMFESVAQPAFIIALVEHVFDKGGDVRALSFWTGVMVPVVVMAVAVTIVCAALYGSEERSRRAFELLRYVISLLRKTGRR